MLRPPCVASERRSFSFLRLRSLFAPLSRAVAGRQGRGFGKEQDRDAPAGRQERIFGKQQFGIRLAGNRGYPVRSSDLSELVWPVIAIRFGIWRSTGASFEISWRARS